MEKIVVLLLGKNWFLLNPQFHALALVLIGVCIFYLVRTFKLVKEVHEKITRLESLVHHTKPPDIYAVSNPNLRRG